MTAPAIGIDLGTTYSCVGVWQNDRVEIIANDQGNRTTPSYVAFTDTERLIGEKARNHVNMNSFNTVFSVKRLIGRKFNDQVVQSDMKHWPFQVVEKEGGKPIFEFNSKEKQKISLQKKFLVWFCLNERNLKLTWKQVRRCNCPCLL